MADSGFNRFLGQPPMSKEARVPSISVPDFVARIVALFDPIVQGRLLRTGEAATSLVGEGARNIEMDASGGDRDSARPGAQPAGKQSGLSGRAAVPGDDRHA